MAWIVLILVSITAFGLIGIALGIFRMGETLRAGLGSVADLFSFIDDEEEEDSWGPLLMDDIDYQTDEETDDAFEKIAEALGDLERKGNKIARREERE